MDAPKIWTCFCIKRMNGQNQMFERNISLNVLAFDKPDAKRRIQKALKRAETPSVQYGLEDIRKGSSIDYISDDLLYSILKNNCPQYMKNRERDEYMEVNKLYPKRKAWQTHL